MPIDCPKNTNVVVNNTPDPCGGVYSSTDCISTPNAIVYLSIPAEATQTEINTAITLDLINKDTRITILEESSNVFTNKVLDLDGEYFLQAEDNRKNLFINSAINDPIISINSSLAVNFECNIFVNGVMDEVIKLGEETVTPPLLVVPSITASEDSLKNWGRINIKRMNTTTYSATGDLYRQTF